MSEAKGFVIKNVDTDQFISIYIDSKGEPFVEYQNDLIYADFFRSATYFLMEGRKDYPELTGYKLEAIPVTITITI